MVIEQEIIRYDQVRHINAHIRKVHFLSEHMHGSFELSYVLAGSGQYRQGHEVRTVEPGALVLVNPYEPHSFSTLENEPLVLLSLQIHKLFARRYIESIPRLRFNSSRLFELSEQRRAELSKYVFLIANAYFANDFKQSFDVMGYSLLLLGRLSNALEWELEEHLDNTDKELQKNRMQRLISYIDENYRQKITLSMLADMEGITPTYMSHFFKKSFGVSFQSYLNMQRFEKALILMRDTSLTMVDICMNCGFSDSRYLEAACQKTFGCSVADYRKRCVDRNGCGHDIDEGYLYKQYSNKESKEIIREYLEKQSMDLLMY